MYPIFYRLTLWASVLPFVGSLFLSYGFRIEASASVIIKGSPVIALNSVSPMAIHIGWFLVVTGFFLRLVSEWQSHRNSTST